MNSLKLQCVEVEVELEVEFRPLLTEIRKQAT